MAMIIFVVCSKDEDGASEQLNLNVKIGDTYSFDGVVSQVVKAPNLFYAEVSADGIKGVHAGTTTARIKVGDTLYNCKITVEPNHTLYVDLISFLGADFETIIGIYGDPIRSEGSTYLFGPLPDVGLEDNNLFAFENGIVESAMIVFSDYYASMITDHLLDRYVLVSMTDDSYLFINALTMEDWTVGVFMTMKARDIRIAYAKRSYLESRSALNAAEVNFERLMK